MLTDYVRTGTYQQAIIANSVNFSGKVVLDVGTGTGILAFFALQAGASMVYAVDASSAAHIAQKLADANGYAGRIKVLMGKIESIDIPEYVDVIISEPIGFLLVHERMLESYVIARDRFLKPNGVMFPSTGEIVLAPFTDDALYKEQLSKVAFWDNSDFYGVDISSVKDIALAECFSQPIVGQFCPKINILLATSHAIFCLQRTAYFSGYVTPASLISTHRTVQSIDFSAVSTEELKTFEILFSSTIDKTGKKNVVCESQRSQPVVIIARHVTVLVLHYYVRQSMCAHECEFGMVGVIYMCSLHFNNTSISSYLYLFDDISCGF
jgi:ubiquinone/menaquinone biosynthesis C-methylase UbiE